MLREEEIYYHAMLAKDRRFDGRFFIGVHTTGVYCRPICPAPKPKLKNVTFYKSAASAEAAGFRPCRRCRPETCPGTPAWSGTSATVSRALKLIGLGLLNQGGIGALENRLGIGQRQLRNLFSKHVGASPRAVAMVHRLDFARKLIDETQLPMTNVALSSGFSSIRRFNDAVKKRFGRSSRALRTKQSGRAIGCENDNRLTLQLPFRPPYDWLALLDFLKSRATPGVEFVSERSYSRTIALGKVEGFIEVYPSSVASHLEATLRLSSTENLMEIIARLRHIFDLEADPLPISRCLTRDKKLQAVIEACPGIRVPGSWEGYELAVRAILGQMVSVKAASTLAGRLVSKYGKQVSFPGASGLTHFFPSARAIANANLVDIGLTRVRAEALRDLSMKVANGELALDGSRATDETIRCLLKIPGVGPWTAQYIALRALRDPDAFPVTDLVIRRALAKFNACSRNGNACHSEMWRPWRAYAVMYIWRMESVRVKIRKHKRRE